MHLHDELAACRPPRPAWWHFPVLALYALMPACFILIALLVPLELKNDFETPADTKMALCVLSYVLGVWLMVVFLVWQQARWHWSLTPDALWWGPRKRHKIPLDALKKIAPGRPMPTKSPVHAVFHRAVKQQAWEIMSAEFTMALLLIFEDGSILPFHVHRCPGGTALMRKLVELHRDALDPDYQCSKEEQRRLRFADWNRLTRPRRRA